MQAYRAYCLRLALTTCLAVAAAPAETLKPLLETLNERLNIGDLVALTKWDSGKPIQDSPREAQVIANARADAAARDLPADALAAIWEQLVEASIAYELVEWDRIRS